MLSSGGSERSKIYQNAKTGQHMKKREHDLGLSSLALTLPFSVRRKHFLALTGKHSAFW